MFYVKFVVKTIGLVQTLCYTAAALPNLVSQDKRGCVRDDVGFMCDLIMEHNLVMLESKRYKRIAYHCENLRLCTELRTSQTPCLAPPTLSSSQALQRGGRKGGTNTAIPHMVAREYRNTASKFSQIPKPQLQMGKS